MRRDLRGRFALDTGALIELVFSTRPGLALKEAMEGFSVEASTTEVHVTELRYILCRRRGFTESKERVDKLLASGYINVEGISHLVLDASKYKCERAISLADCLCLALASRSFCSAVFARREKDLVTEMQKKPFDVEILFLEDYG